MPVHHLHANASGERPSTSRRMGRDSLTNAHRSALCWPSSSLISGLHMQQYSTMRRLDGPLECVVLASAPRSVPLPNCCVCACVYTIYVSEAASPRHAGTAPAPTPRPAPRGMRGGMDDARGARRERGVPLHPTRAGDGDARDNLCARPGIRTLSSWVSPTHEGRHFALIARRGVGS